MRTDNLIFLEKKRLEGRVAVLGIPADLGKDDSGAADAPNYLRKLGLLSVLSQLGAKVRDLKDIKSPLHGETLPGDRRVKYLRDIVSVSEVAAAKVAESVVSGYRVVVLGGDHTVSLGTVAGASSIFGKDLGLIWIDAHSDINTPDTTPTGNVHGQVSSAALGLGHPQLVNVFKKGPKIKKENILYIGLKDIDQEEVDALRRHKLNYVTNFDLLRYGLAPAEDAIKKLCKKVKNIWVSLDVDVIDKEYLPATLMPNTGGLNNREITALARYLGRTCPVRGMDVVELAPKNDVGDKSGQLVIEIIAAMLGSEYSDYTRYIVNHRLQK